jgi:DNA-binding MarR family transcriptional regulator
MKFEYKQEMGFFSDGDMDYELWNLFTIGRYATFRVREKELRRYGLTPEHAQILFVARALGEKATINAIARYILRAPHSVSAIIERMQRKRLVKKIRDPDRKKMVTIVLTERGLKAYELTSQRKPIHEIMAVLDENDRRDLRRCLEKILYKSSEVLGREIDDLF